MPRLLIFLVLEKLVLVAIILGEYFFCFCCLRIFSVTIHITSQCRSRDWELAAADEEETQLQKYNRLKLEVENLIAEISNFSVKSAL